MKSLFKKVFLLLILAIGIFFAFHSISARELEIDWPPSPFFNTDLTDASTLTDLMKYLYEWGIALGGLATFVALLIAGFLYLTSVGDPQKMQDARGRIISALLGMVLLLGAWLILNTINPDLTVLRMPAKDFNDIPNLLCDDPCAKYNGGEKADCLALDIDSDGNLDCGWKNLGTGYCYYNKATSCKTYTNLTSCGANSDCNWNKTYNYCYNKYGCEKGFVCVNDPKPGDEDKKGVCTSPTLNNKPVCEYARVWKGKDFANPSVIAEIDDNVDIPDDGPGSIKAFFDDSDYDNKCSSKTIPGDCAAVPANLDGSAACEWNIGKNKCFQFCGKDACGCMLELFDVGTPCSDKLYLMQAYSPDLSVYSEQDSWLGDGRPDCVKVTKPFY